MKFKIGDKWFSTKDNIFVKKRDLTQTIWKKGTADSAIVGVAEKILTQELEKWRKK